MVEARFVVAAGLVMVTLGGGCSSSDTDNDSGGDGGASSVGSFGGSSSGGGEGCGLDFGDSCLNQCTDNSCCAESSACANAPGNSCVSLNNCAAQCTTDACFESCVNQFPNGAEVLVNLFDCMDANCGACSGGGSGGSGASGPEEEDCAIGVAAFCFCLDDLGEPACTDSERSQFFSECTGQGDPRNLVCFGSYVNSQDQINCGSAVNGCF